MGTERRAVRPSDLPGGYRPPPWDYMASFAEMREARNERLRSAGIRPAANPEGMARTDRVTVKRRPRWLALLLRVAARLGLGR